MSSLINIALFLAIIIFIYPQPISKTIKKILPALLIIAAVLATVVGLQQFTSRTVRITALNEKNEDSGGSEVWLKKVFIDGEEHKPDEYFSEGWISEKGFYKWRDYNVTGAELPKSINAVFNLDSDIELVFDSNKWRGRLEVRYGLNRQILDCYSAQEDDGTGQMVLKIPGMTRSRISLWKYLIVIGGGLLLLLYVYFGFFSKKTKKKSTESTSSERIIWIDLLKVIACFFIVVIHATGNIYSINPSRSVDYLFALLANTVTRCAVPIFIMISGSLLIKKQTDIKKTLDKARQAVIVLLIWSLVFILFSYDQSHQPYDLLKAIVTLPFKRGPSGHLWYGYLLVWMYVFAPIVSAIYFGMSKEIKQYFFIIAIIVPGLIDIIVNICFTNGIESPLKGYSIYMQIIYIAMMMLGKYIVEYGDGVYRKISKSLGISIIGLMGTILLTVYLIKRTGQSSGTFFSEVSLSNIIYGAGLVWLFSCFKTQLQQWPSVIKKGITSIASVCLGIYYGHALLIWCFGNFYNKYANILIIFIICIIYFLVSWAIASMMKAVPFLKKLVS